VKLTYRWVALLKTGLPGQACNADPACPTLTRDVTLGPPAPSATGKPASSEPLNGFTQSALLLGVLHELLRMSTLAAGAGRFAFASKEFTSRAAACFSELGNSPGCRLCRRQITSIRAVSSASAHTPPTTAPITTPRLIPPPARLPRAVQHGNQCKHTHTHRFLTHGHCTDHLPAMSKVVTPQLT
jgi:hypothetical protein